MSLRELARLYPVHACLHWLGDNLTSRGRNPDMVNDEWSGAEALENAFRVADQELRRAGRERDVALRKKGEAFDRAVRAERERDEWKASADKWHGEWQKIAPARTVTREDVRKALTDPRCGAVDAVCALFGVEAEPADPLLGKAQEFAALADWELTDREAELLHTVARHVLGQEDRHVDQ